MALFFIFAVNDPNAPVDFLTPTLAAAAPMHESSQGVSH